MSPSSFSQSPSTTSNNHSWPRMRSSASQKAMRSALEWTRRSVGIFHNPTPVKPGSHPTGCQQPLPTFTTSKRHSSSSSGATGSSDYGYHSAPSGQGPAQDKLRIVPFKMNVQQAEEVFQNYHGHSFFSAKAGKVDKVEALYVPFWAASGSVRSRLINAQVGWDHMVTRYNNITKQNETSWETQWKSIQTQHEFTHSYPSTIPDLQIYASYKYRRGFVNQIRSSTSILDAKPPTPADMESKDPEDKRRGIQNRGLDPFTLKPAIALKFVRTAIENEEVRTAERWLVEAYKCDRARIISMDFQYSGLVLAPVYIPVFIFSIRHLDRTFRTFVQAHDSNGLAGGIRFYSWQRISAATAICAIAGLTFLGTARTGMGMTTGFWLGVVAPSLLVAWSVLYYPILDYRVRDWWRQREMDGHYSEATAEAWDTDWTKAYDRFEEEQRRQDWNENKQYQSSSSSSSERAGAHGDPMGYYETLGVPKNASIQEIQSAFRGLALKWHPDRFSSAHEKSIGKKKFQEITEAYSVLRNPKKRKSYDLYGRA